MNTCSQCVSLIGLFQQCETRCAAIVLAIVAFVFGVIAMCVVCKLFCRKSANAPCGCKKSAPKAAAKKEERPFEKRKPHPAPADGSVEIYVGNLSYEMTEEQLRNEFSAYGKVGLVRLITNRYNGKSKGYGFVQMPDRKEAEKAIAALNDKEIQGRMMKCNEAKNLI